jgi:putative DNA primase/helicase
MKVEPPKAAVCVDKARAMLSNVWSGATPITDGDPVHLYLRARVPGCNPVALPVRYHPALPYYHEPGKVTTHPAMVARVLDSSGKPISIHRTYLAEDGKKADVECPKKLMTGTAPMNNCAIRLAPPKDGWLGVAEGIETALAASVIHKVPVWSCVSAGILEKFRPPEGVTDLFIFGDNDRSFTGQSAAYNLARAVTLLGIECHVVIPPKLGTDWADDQTPPGAPPAFEIPPGWPNTARIVPGSKKSR